MFNCCKHSSYHLFTSQSLSFPVCGSCLANTCFQNTKSHAGVPIGLILHTATCTWDIIVTQWCHFICHFNCSQWRSEGRAWPGTCPAKAPCSSHLRVRSAHERGANGLAYSRCPANTNNLATPLIAFGPSAIEIMSTSTFAHNQQVPEPISPWAHLLVSILLTEQGSTHLRSYNLTECQHPKSGTYHSLMSSVQAWPAHTLGLGALEQKGSCKLTYGVNVASYQALSHGMRSNEPRVSGCMLHSQWASALQSLQSQREEVGRTVLGYNNLKQVQHMVIDKEPGGLTSYL